MPLACPVPPDTEVSNDVAVLGRNYAVERRTQTKSSSAHLSTRIATTIGRRFESLEPRKMLSVSGDFNGDGLSDLAIGSPGLKSGSAAGAGGVSIIYGQNITGLATPNNQLWTMSQVREWLAAPKRKTLLVPRWQSAILTAMVIADLAIGLPAATRLCRLERSAARQQLSMVCGLAF